jgi:hypothetical protein
MREELRDCRTNYKAYKCPNCQKIKKIELTSEEEKKISEYLKKPENGGIIYYQDIHKNDNGECVVYLDFDSCFTIRGADLEDPSKLSPDLFVIYQDKPPQP